MDGKSAIALEICVDSASGLATAARAGADRVELCSALSLGGLTPGPGLISAARRTGIPCHAMIRPRSGDFVFEIADLMTCLADVRAMRAAGLAGVVIGASRADSRLDLRALDALVAAAGPMEVTLHRAFDLTPDPYKALEEAIDLGVARILTSGQAPTAAEGAPLLARLVQRAAGRIEVMAGGGVNARNARLLTATGADALHASCGVRVPLRQPVERIGLSPIRQTNAKNIAALRAAMTEGQGMI